MGPAFIIMQIGNPDLDAMCEAAIVPALVDAGFDPKRVDKHNQGGLLKNEIVSFIEQADMIVADLTNERPNCYLEIGYAMGIGKFSNLILMAREDHAQDSPNHKSGEAKVHFDLAGYDILFWHPDDLDGLRTELQKRIARRLAVTSQSTSGLGSTWDEEWISSHREKATAGLKAAGRTSFMELRFSLRPPKITQGHRELDEAVRGAQIATFGWPIGIYFDNRTEFKPRPTTEGIVAEIHETARETYDYWSLRRNGDYYFLGSLFEDMRKPEEIFMDTRIVRVTESLLYAARLYTRLGVDPSSEISLAVRHGGLAGRSLASSGGRMPWLGNHSPIQEDQSESQVTTTLQAIESKLVELVKEILDPLFILFDFSTIQDSAYQQLVNNFVEGRII